MSGASSSLSSAARQSRGRSRRARSPGMRRIGVLIGLAGKRSGNEGATRRHSGRGSNGADGRRAAMSASTIASRRQRGSVSGARERAGRSAARRDPRTIDAGRRRAAAGEPHDPDRVRRRLRSDRLGLCREPGAAGRQSHRACCIRGEHHRQMAGDAQGDRAAPGARRLHRQPQDDRL